MHDFNGSNYRMTEVQAAVGNYQLTKLSAWVKNEILLPIKFGKF